MITYRSGGVHYFTKLFQLRGSVFPFAIKIAVPVSIVAFFVKLEDLPSKMGLNEEKFLNDNAVWSGFTFLVGFLIVFRTSQAYARFWSGCTATHLMRAEWFDSCSAIVSFCRHHKPHAEQQILHFQHVLIRLFSLLHALAMAEIEDSTSDDPSKVDAYRYELVDVSGLDEDTMDAIKTSDSKVEMVYTWIQMIVVDALREDFLTIPPPILTRAFQELANGMVQFHDAIKISTIPFPFPYAQLCDGLLVMHMTLTPLVVSQWVTQPWTCAVFSFLQVFTFWSLNAIAVEIENPFGTDDNDIEGHVMQQEMNRHLITLLCEGTKRMPRLSEKAVSVDEPEWLVKMSNATMSLWECWDEMSRSARRDVRMASSVRGTVRRSSMSATFPVTPDKRRANMTIDITQSRRKQVANYKSNRRGVFYDEKSKNSPKESPRETPKQHPASKEREEQEDVNDSAGPPSPQPDLVRTMSEPSGSKDGFYSDAALQVSPSPIPSSFLSLSANGNQFSTTPCEGIADDSSMAPAACPPARSPVWQEYREGHQIVSVEPGKSPASKSSKMRDNDALPPEGRSNGTLSDRIAPASGGPLTADINYPCVLDR